MSTTKNISYDFEVTSFVGIEAPEGTDPETLIEQAAEEFVRRFRSNEAEIQCFQTYDYDTGFNTVMLGPNRGTKVLVHGATSTEE
jgi:hypothetical protein